MTIIGEGSEQIKQTFYTDLQDGFSENQVE